MSSLQTSYRSGYRSDIEGLRAVAILLVVAAHVRLPNLAGGFVGVDVFFVLSGYLITGLLIQEIRSIGYLDLRLFYARRLRRLLPNLLLMLLSTCVLGRFLLAPGQQMDQAGAAAGASLWFSNFVFAFGNLDYFGASADSNLFLHTWSLGVEEQFYLIWPLLLIVATGAWRGKTNVLRPASIIAAMVSVLALSLALCAAWMRAQPLLAFYMMPARAWQFAIGALVYLLLESPAASVAPARGASTQRRGMMLRAGGWSGLAAILATAMIIDGKTPYPGVWALCPSLGAAAVLASGTHFPGNAVGRLLSLRPMQAIGRVSYAWYLWHWPVLLLGATILEMNSAANRLALAGASLIIATISYHGLEKAVRTHVELLRRPGMAIAGAVALMILGNALALCWQTDARLHMAAADMQLYQDAHLDQPAIYPQGCDDWRFSDRVKLCSYGAVDAAHTAMAVGDSVALQWFPAFAQLFVRPGWQLIIATKSSCPMVDEPIYYSRLGRGFSECERWRNALLARIAAIKPDIVIFGSTFTYDLTQTEWTDGTTRILDRLAPASGQVYIMRSTPVLGFDGPSCLEPRSWLYRTLSQHATCDSPARSERSDSVFLWLTQAANRFSNVKMLDMTDAICPRGVCSAEHNGVIVFRDSQHLTATFAASLLPALRQRLALGLEDDSATLGKTSP